MNKIKQEDISIIEARKQIGIKIRKARLSKKLGTLKLSKIVGIEKSQILKVELNKGSYEIDTLLKICKALEIGIEL